MKKLTAFMAAMSLASGLIAPASPVSSGLVEVSAPVSQAITAECIESALALESGSLTGVTVTALPPFESGRLICEGIEVEAFDYLPRKSLEWLVYESFTNDATVRFSLLPDTGEIAKECSLALVLEGDFREVEMTNAALAWKHAEAAYFSALRKVD